MRRHVLLLTATVTPRAKQPELALTDPGARLRDHESAPESYVGLLRGGVLAGTVFAENSGHDLRPLAARFGSAGIEWLNLPPIAEAHGFHRGHDEFHLVDEAMARATLLRALGGRDLVWKISGRYIVRNLRQVLRWAPASADYYGEVRPDWAELSVIAWSCEGYRRIVHGLWKRFATSIPPEPILCELLEHITGSGEPPLRIVRSFAWPPFIVGRRGSNGRPFQDRRTIYKFSLQLAQKMLALPVRRLTNR